MAKKKFSISIDALKEEAKKRDITFTIRLEEGLLDTFKKVCADELDLNASAAIRGLMKQICEQYGYDMSEIK